MSNSSEGSPYWNWLGGRGNSDDMGGMSEMREPATANPDKVAEQQDAVGNLDRPLMLQVIYEVLAALPPREKDVLDACGFRGLTMQEAADELHISKSTVRDALDRVRAKAEKLYATRKAQSGVDRE